MAAEKISPIAPNIAELLLLTKPENKPSISSLKEALLGFEKKYQIAVIHLGDSDDEISFMWRGSEHKLTPEGVFSGLMSISGPEFVNAYLQKLQEQLEEKSKKIKELQAVERALMSVIQSAK